MGGWEFWSDFLNSKGDYYPIQSDAEKYKQENPEEAKLIEKLWIIRSLPRK